MFDAERTKRSVDRRAAFVAVGELVSTESPHPSTCDSAPSCRSLMASGCLRAGFVASLKGRNTHSTIGVSKLLKTKGLYSAGRDVPSPKKATHSCPSPGTGATVSLVIEGVRCAGGKCSQADRSAREHF